MTKALGLNMPRRPLDDAAEDYEIEKARKEFAVFITDQNHPVQREKLPEGAIPGFSVALYRKGGKKPLQSMWAATRVQAEKIAAEYWREVLTMEVTGWNKKGRG